MPQCPPPHLMRLALIRHCAGCNDYEADVQSIYLDYGHEVFQQSVSPSLVIMSNVRGIAALALKLGLAVYRKKA